MKNIDLSVVVPVYNTEQFLRRSLDSIILALQKLSNWTYELIVINDGSKGNCDEIIDEYVKQYTFIRYKKQENSGLAETKNVGLKIANGEYISFIDSDDYIDPNFYIDAFNKIIKDNADVIIYDWESVSKEGKFTVPAKNSKYADDKLGCIDISIMPSSCNKIVKKSLFSGLSFPKGLRYEDLGTTLIVLLRAENICYLAKPYYKYVLTEGSIMRSGFDERNFQMIDIFEILFSRLDELDYITNDEKDMYKYMVYTRRLYEDLIELIAISKASKEKKEEMCKLFCEKIHNINVQMCENKYFKENVFNANSLKRNYANRILHKCINNNNYKKLNGLLKTKVYYRFFYIKYLSKDVIDRCKAEK